MSELGEAFVPIRATLDKLDGDLAQARGKVEGAIGKISQVAGNVGANLQKVGKIALGSIGVITGVAGAAAVGIAALAANAEPLIGLQQGFAAVTERIGTSSETMLSSLQDASGGLITNRDLMQSFNQAAALVSDDFAKSLPDAMSLVRRASQATGQDMGFLFDSLVKGVGRVSPMILDNLGIQVALAEVTDRAAEMFGKSTDELSKQEQQAALTEIVMEKLNKAYGDVPDVTPTFAKIKTTIANLKDEIGLKLLPVMTPLVEKILGLAEKALPVLMDVLDNRILPVLMDIAGAFGNFLDGLMSGEDIIGDVANLFYELGLAFGLSEDQAAGLYQGVISVIEGFQSFIANIQEVLAPVIEWVKENVELKDALIALGIAILTVVVPALAPVIAGILGTIAVFAAITAAIALLRNAWETNWGGIRDKTQAVINFIVPLVQNAIAGVRDWWAQNGDAILAKAREIWENIQTAISNFASWVVPKVQEFVASIRQFWVDHGDAIVAKAQEIWDKVTAIFEFFRDQFSKIFEAFRLALEGDWEGFGEKLREVWDAVWEAIKDIAGKAWDWIKEQIGNLITNIIDQFTSTDWGSVGDSIVQGLANGITSGVHWIIKAVQGLGAAAIAAIKGFLGIKSPSTLFAEIGHDIVMGLIEGMEDEKGQLEKAVSGLLDFAGSFASLGGPAGGLFQRRVIDPLKDQIDGLNDSAERSFDKLLSALSDSGLDNLVQRMRDGETDIAQAFNEISRMPGLDPRRQEGLLNIIREIWAAQGQASQLGKELSEQQAKLLELQRQQENLSFLQQQVNLLNTIAEHGLDAQQILGGLKLGINADLGEVIEAMTKAMEEIINQAETELGIHSPSKVFENVGKRIMEGLAFGVKQFDLDRLLPVMELVDKIGSGGQNEPGATHYWSLEINEAGRVVDPGGSMAMMKALAGVSGV